MRRTTLIIIMSALCMVGLLAWLMTPAPNLAARPALNAEQPTAPAKPSPEKRLAAEEPMSPQSGTIVASEPAARESAPAPAKPAPETVEPVSAETATAEPEIVAPEPQPASEPPPIPQSAFPGAHARPSTPQSEAPSASTTSAPSSMSSTLAPEPPDAQSEALDLQYFEDRLDESPRVAAADAERQAQEREASRIDHENGLKAVAGANASRVSDPYLGQYNAGTVYGGLSYPILGSRSREQASLESAKAQAHSLKGRAELARRDDLRELRRSYAQYWIAGRQIEAARAFLSAEAEVVRLLERRAAAGLLRESKRLDLLTAFDAARSDLASFGAARAVSLMTINRIAGAALREFKPLPPALPANWPDQDAVLQRVAENPELEALRALLANRHDLLSYAANHYPESDLLLSLSGIDYWPGGVGGDALLGVEFRVPIGVVGAQREGKAAARLSLIQYQRELDNRTQVLQGQAVETFGLVEAKGAALALAGRKLAAAEQALREDFSRANRDSPDSLEALLQSRRDYYRAATDCLAAEMDLLTTRTALLALTGDPEPPPPEKPRAAAPEQPADAIKPNLLGGELLPGVGEETAATKPAPPSIPQSAIRNSQSATSAAEGMAVYMWATQDWLDRTRQLDAKDKRLPSACDYENDPMWRDLADYKVRTVLLSLDGAQISEVAGDAQAFTHLVRLIGAAHDRRLRIELLLGEPTWILPAHRQELLNIIGKLRAMPFDGLNLDLEPNQLNPAEAQVSCILHELIETLRAAKAVSPWEIALTLEPNYLDKPACLPASEFGGETLGSALEKAGVRRVALMVYRSDPARISERAGELLRAYPGLRLTIAVSVEPAQTVGAKVTLAGEGRRKFYDTAWALDEAFRAYPNYAGLAVQDWASLRNLKP